MKNTIIINIIIAILLQTGYIDIVRSDGVIQFERRTDEVKIDESTSSCPNNRTECRETETCCKTKHNSYHCCRYKNAVCCPDQFHCCPHGSTCDTEKKRCTRNLDFDKSVDSIEWKIEDDSVDKDLNPSTSLLSFSNSEEYRFEGEAMCSNNKTQCKDTKTCCITKHGNYYCCPHKNAVCCSDKWSCCPEGTTCDIKNKKCLSSTITKSNIVGSNIPKKSSLTPIYNVSLLESFLSFFFKLNEVCKDASVACPVGGKCCGMNAGAFGCCSYKEGVCCPNLSVCCPRDSICGDKNHACVSKVDNHVPISKLIDPRTDICPDGKTECYSWQTCCMIGDGLYGCCPYRNATCCADKATCCRENFKCDKNQCIPMNSLFAARTVDAEDSKVVPRKSLMIFLSKIGLKKVCPDNEKCTEDSTCCSISTDKYGCCGYKSGVCCSDSATCCPSDTKCIAGGCAQI